MGNAGPQHNWVPLWDILGIWGVEIPLFNRGGKGRGKDPGGTFNYNEVGDIWHSGIRIWAQGISVESLKKGCEDG